MRILVDITHPAHVHFFRHAIGLWRHRGHEVAIAGRNKDIAYKLMKRLDLDYTDLGSARAGLVGLAFELLVRNARLHRFTGLFKPDVMTAIGGIWISHVGWLRRIPSVVFTDTENATLSNKITFPFATIVSTPACFEAEVPTGKHRTYNGYHELAYTHPKRFQPDAAVLDEFGLSAKTPFIILRLVSWGAAHDIKDHGFTQLENAVEQLEHFGRVIVSSEAALPPHLTSKRITASPEKIHHLLYFASLLIGESATMASESAMLGTPSIFVSTSRRGYTNEQESKYGLTFTFDDPKTAQADALERAVEILENPKSKADWQKKRERMLRNVIDVTEYVADLVENSARI